MNKNEIGIRKLVVLATGLATLLTVGSIALCQRNKARELEVRAEERRIKAHNTIDQAIREIERFKSSPPPAQAPQGRQQPSAKPVGVGK